MPSNLRFYNGRIYNYLSYILEIIIIKYDQKIKNIVLGLLVNRLDPTNSLILLLKIPIHQIKSRLRF